MNYRGHANIVVHHLFPFKKYLLFFSVNIFHGFVWLFYHVVERLKLRKNFLLPRKHYLKITPYGVFYSKKMHCRTFWHLHIIKGSDVFSHDVFFVEEMADHSENNKNDTYETTKCWKQLNCSVRTPNMFNFFIRLFNYFPLVI